MGQCHLPYRVALWNMWGTYIAPSSTPFPFSPSSCGKAGDTPYNKEQGIKEPVYIVSSAIRLSCAWLRYCYILTLKKKPWLGALMVQEPYKGLLVSYRHHFTFMGKSTSQSSHFMDKETDYVFASLSLTAKTWESWEENSAHTPDILQSRVADCGPDWGHRTNNSVI